MTPIDPKDREQALALLQEYTKSESLLKHAYTVEAAMRAAARRQGSDEDSWGNVGLLHDFDYERYPTAEDHPARGAEILRERGYPEDFVLAILGHASHTGVSRDTERARWLFAVDELCGFCTACALVQPDKKVASVKVKSVKKKMKRKEFAAKVSRDEIRQGAAEVGLELPDLITLVLGAMCEAASELGL